jgi:single-strand DNA-binding protein
MNKAILMGRLTKEPELRYAQGSNLEICNFSIAINRKFAKPTDEVKADFINIVAFGKTAVFCSQYFQKGRQVAIVGRIQTSSWDGQDGKKQYKTEVIADEVFFADSKPSGDTVNSRPATMSTPGVSNNNDSLGNGFSIDENDDELPF